MSKYYALLIAVVVLALLYAFLADPCNRLVRIEFAEKNPGTVIVGSGADQGSPESVQCRVSYRRPGDEQVYEDVWLYQNPGKNGWQFAKVIEAGKIRRTP